MALTRHDHVVVARQAQLCRPSGPRGDKRRHPGDLRRLTLLAAEGTAHPPHLDRHRGVGQVQQMGDAMLHLGRMLRRAVDQHAAVLARDRQRNLPFEIEMVLSPRAEPPGQAMGRGGKRAGGIAALHDLRRGDITPGGKRLLDREHRRQLRVIDGDALCRLPRRREALGRDDRDGLTRILHNPFSKARLVLEDRRDVVDTGNVRRGQHHSDAGQSACRHGVDAEDTGMGVRAHHQLAMQKARRLRHVVDKARGAGDVEPGAIVMPRRAGSAGDAAGRGIAHSAITSSGRSDRAISSQNRRSKLPATCVR